MNGLKHITGIVTERRPVTGDLWIVRIRPSLPIHFEAGQYVTVGLPLNGKIVERPYSIVSAPREAELEFFVERVPEGKLTPALYEVPEGGELLLRTAAKGRFLLDRASGHPNHFMAATVTGVAPFVSMVRDLSGRDADATPTFHIVLLHGASQPEELAYAEELETQAARFSWFEYVPTISRPWLSPGWRGETGRLEDVLRKHLDRAGFTPRDSTAYACGHPGMIRNAEAILTRRGFEKAFIREEMYWPGR